MSTPPLTQLGFDPDVYSPCYGKGDLFTSVDPADHAEARRLCNGTLDGTPACPYKKNLACERLLQWEFDNNTAGVTGGPQGTYAGRLIGARKRPGRPRRNADDAA